MVGEEKKERERKEKDESKTFDKDYVKYTKNEDSFLKVHVSSLAQTVARVSLWHLYK